MEKLSLRFGPYIRSPLSTSTKLGFSITRRRDRTSERRSHLLFGRVLDVARRNNRKMRARCGPGTLEHHFRLSISRSLKSPPSVRWGMMHTAVCMAAAFWHIRTASDIIAMGKNNPPVTWMFPRRAKGLRSCRPNTIANPCGASFYSCAFPHKSIHNALYYVKLRM